MCKFYSVRCYLKLFFLVLNQSNEWHTLIKKIIYYLYKNKNFTDTKCNISIWYDLPSACLTFTRLLISPHLGVFIALGLSGVIPAMHYVITEGFYQAVNFAALGWLVLMAVLYIVGAVIYAVRIPERIWPGKFDIWVRRRLNIVFMREDLCSRCFWFICWTHVRQFNPATG